MKGEMCIWGVRIQMAPAWGLVGGVTTREMVAAMTMAATTTTATTMATTTARATTIVAVGDNVEGEESGGEIEAAGVAEEAEEIGVSEETEGAEEIAVAEETGEEGAAEGAEGAEGHGVVKETPTTRQTHTSRWVGAKLAVLPQTKPDRDKAQKHTPPKT